MVVHVRMPLERYIIPLKSLLVVEIATDESGTWGCPRPLVSGPVGLKVTQPIAVKELIPIILAWYGATAGETSKSNATVIIRWWWHACSLEQAKKQEHYAHASLHGLH